MRVVEKTINSVVIQLFIPDPLTLTNLGPVKEVIEHLENKRVCL